MKILFTGGGTGGHLMPIIAIGRELKGKDGIKLYYLGPKDEQGGFLLAQENFKIHSILSGKIRRYFSFWNITDVLFGIPIGFLQGFFWILVIRPNLVFSKGGSGSLVVCWAARIFRISVFLHESDSVPGLSNKIVSKWAKKVFVSFSFEKTEGFENSILVGNPTRKELLNGSIEEAKKIFNLTLEKPVILIMGGSQGAMAINEFIMVILNNLLEKYEIIHVAGLKNYKKIKLESEVVFGQDLEKYYHLYPTLNEVELKNAYAAADLVISRAGSGSIFEIAAVGKPSILIPLPSAAGNHQSKNAYQYAESGAAIVLEQDNLSPNLFLGEVESAFSKKEKMEKAALNFSKPNAAELITKEILNFKNDK